MILNIVNCELLNIYGCVWLNWYDDWIICSYVVILVQIKLAYWGLIGN